MNRRNFIKNSSVAGLTVTALGFASCNTAVVKDDKASSPGAAPSAGFTDNFALHEITIDALQQKMQSGEYSSKAITQLYIDRIAQTDKAGPKLNAVIEMNPDAISIAEALDAERKAGKVRGPLHGIPVLIKDNIDTADKMQTTAGALALAGNIAKQDAFIITKLRAAGAVLLGKTNLSEWANFRSTSSCSGWSSRGGQTKSPYILDHNPCGSSSGSGVAVAANLCVVAIGTETDGSITCPASVCGLVGIKPTVGLLSRSGIIPISSTQDTAGPLARTVTDAAFLLSALSGNDPADAATANAKGQPDYISFLKTDALKGKRIGIDRKKKSTNQNLEKLLNDAITALQQQGAVIVDINYLEKINPLGKYETEILQTEFKEGVNKYLANSSSKIKTLAEVIAFNKANEEKAMPYFKQEQLELCDKKTGLQAAAYTEALDKGHITVKKIIDTVIAENKLDAIAGITMGPSCSIDMQYGDRWGDDFLTQPAAMSGYPHITVPCGSTHGLPVGFSFFNGAYTEATLIGMAYSYEQATKKRLAPAFVKSYLD